MSCAGSFGWNWRTRNSTSTTHAAWPGWASLTPRLPLTSNPVHRVESVSLASRPARRRCPPLAGAGSARHTIAASPLALSSLFLLAPPESACVMLASAGST